MSGYNQHSSRFFNLVKPVFKNNLSLFTLLIVGFVLISVAIFHPPKNILSWDVFGHYLYLPALFIYNDLGLKESGFVRDILSQYHNSATFYQVVVAPTGNLVIKYSSGLALLYLPFFFLGHLIAIIRGFPADGFSLPYQYAIFGGCLFYSLVGLFFLRKVLLEFFDEIITSVVIIMICLGSNYFSESVYKGAMSHNILFTLYAIILWLTIKWHENFKARYAVLLGLTTGLASMSRPTDIVCILIPLFWGIYNRETLLIKIRQLIRYRSHLLLAAAGFLLAWLPQLVYWKIYAGSFLFYSYDNPGEGFEFLRPYLINVLFSFRKGWFVYTPLMIFSIAGFYFLYKQNRKLLLPLLLYFLINLYLVSSWSCWWYAESFGQRALVQSYVVMSITLGYFVGFIGDRSLWIKALTAVIFIALIVLNLFQNWQLNHGILHGSRMTREYYFAVFGKMHTSPEAKKLLLIERSATIEEKFKDSSGFLPAKELIYYDFEKAEPSLNIHVVDSLAHSGRYCLKMERNFKFSPGITIPYKNLTKKDYAWIRASVYIYPVTDLDEESPLLVVTFGHHNRYYKYRAASLRNRQGNYLLNQWNLLTMDYMTPEVRSKNDKLSVYLWFRGKTRAYADDLKVEIIEPEK